MTTCEPAKLVTWSDRYSVGVGSIDGQHQKLVDLVNQLHSAMKVGKAAPQLGKILDSLAQYTVSHFTAEEAMMQRAGYQGLAAHKLEHDKLVAKVKALQADLRSGKVVLSHDILAFLQNWLINHIMGVDKKYSSQLQAAGIR